MTMHILQRGRGKNCNHCYRLQYSYLWSHVSPPSLPIWGLIVLALHPTQLQQWRLFVGWFQRQGTHEESEKPSVSSLFIPLVVLKCGCLCKVLPHFCLRCPVFITLYPCAAPTVIWPEVLQVGGFMVGLGCCFISDLRLFLSWSLGWALVGSEVFGNRFFLLLPLTL